MQLQWAIFLSITLIDIVLKVRLDKMKNRTIEGGKALVGKAKNFKLTLCNS